MCGIFGIAGFQKIDDGRFRESVNTLVHRGPDSTGVRYWEKVAFGFTRLAIQDLSPAGNQPMSHPTEPFHIVFNGEIYNFHILRDQLIKLGASLSSKTDTEVILHAYHLWGWEETLNRLEGMFGLAIYDQRKSVLLLARDRFGQKPLFYCQDDQGSISFSSEIKALLKYRNKAELNFINSLNPLFTTGLSPAGQTMFEGVQQLKQGSYLEYDLLKKTSRQKQYFHVSQWVSEPLYREISGYSEEKLLSVYQQAVTEAVEQHLISDAPLASLFSAGVDSSLITAAAAKYGAIKLYHYESELLDLLSYAHDFAGKFKLDLHIEKGNDREFIYEMPRLIYHYETINKEEGVVLGKLCRLARKDGIKVLLAGDASDELFGGYFHHSNFMVRDKVYRFYNSKTMSFFIKALNRLFPYNPTQYTDENPLGTHYGICPPGAHFDEVPLNCLYHRGERLNDWQQCLNTYDFVSNKTDHHVAAHILDELSYRLQRFMIRSDRFGMMESVEIRTPLLNSAVVRLAVNTPLKWKIRRKLSGGFERKYLLKKLAVRMGVPRHISFRKKMITPHNSAPQMLGILSKWKLTNLAEFLKIDAMTLKKIALESYDRDLSRIQYCFLSMEILIRLFVLGDKPEKIADEFRAILVNRS